MKNKRASSFLRAFSLFAGSSLYLLKAVAAPINFATEPLFLQDNVQPNILIVADDSTSMGYETLLNNGTANPGTNTAITLNFSPNTDGEARNLCPGYNTLAYNRHRTYTPWKGTDSAGVAFDHITNLGSARVDPYDPTSTTDISNHMYFLWNDANNDGEYDDGECPSLPWTLLTPASERPSLCESDPGCVNVADHPSTLEHGAPGNEQSADRNYGNWYTYYRKRAYVAQRALSELVDESDARMGLGTLHNDNNVGTPIQDMTNATNKAELLSQIADIGATGFTPLRRALYNAGRYFESGNGALFGLPLASLDSPILDVDQGGTCQQNYTILMSDGYANRTTPVDIGDTDSDGNTVFDGGVYADGPSTNNGGFALSANSNFLADYAMHYFERDLRPNLDDRVPEDPARHIDNLDNQNNNMHQHMVTYTVAFGVNGTLDCTPLFDAGCLSRPAWSDWDQNTESGDTAWPGRISYVLGDNDPRTIDDMRHAAFNGRGEFLSANNPDTLINNLQEAIADIEGRNSSSAAVAASSTSLNAGTVIYQAKFNSGDWSGDLVSIPISNGSNDTRSSCSTVDMGQPCPTANWNAGTDTDGINSQNFHTGRVVVTYRPPLTGTDGTAVPFRWPTNSASPTALELSTDQLNALATNPTTEEQDEEYGENLVNYIRGDQSNELPTSGSPSSSSAIFRQRDASVLGDIIHSSPHFVGPPNSNYTENDYATFAETHETRQPIVYVGANDGMLHAFNANADTSTGGGDLVFSYIPGSSYPHIRNLATPTYQHRYFVDGSPTSADVYFNESWHTVLVSGLKAGGQKIFALDITDPENFTENQDHINNVFLWEFEHPELGYTFSEPDIIKLNDDSWAAIFGNGYNNTEDDGSHSESGHASLFIVDIETKAATNISTGVGSVDTPNGLATVTPVDEDGNGTTDYAYAGDLEGNLWRFDLSSDESSDWSVTRIFTAVSPEGNPQPITSRPSVGFHPEDGRDGFLIYFGTGRYIDASDNNSTDVDTQSFYAVWDDLTNGTLPALDRNDDDYLQQEIISQDSVTFGNGTPDTDDDVTVDLRFTSTQDTEELIDWDTQKGWFIDFIFDGDNNGERQVSRSLLRGDRIVFVTIAPDDTPCNFGGTNVLMELSTMDGQPAASAPLDVNGDGVIDSTDVYDSQIPSGIISDGIKSAPDVVGTDEGVEFKLMNSSSGVATSIAERPPSGAGQSDAQRTSWTELVNF